MSENINDKSKKISAEIGMEKRIENGEEIEITEAVEILQMIKKNISIEEISKKTGKPVSDVINLNLTVFKGKNLSTPYSIKVLERFFVSKKCVP